VKSVISMTMVLAMITVAKSRCNQGSKVWLHMPHVTGNYQLAQQGDFPYWDAVVREGFEPPKAYAS